MLDGSEYTSKYIFRPHFYQSRSAWSVDQGSNKNHSPAYNFAPTVTKFCVMWEGLSLPHDTKFGNCRCKIVDSRSFPSWSLIHGLRWSGLIKVGPVFPDTWPLIDPWDGSWSNFHDRKGSVFLHIANNMSMDDLAMQGDRSPAVMALTQFCGLSTNTRKMSTALPSHCRQMVDNTNIYSLFFKTIPHKLGKHVAT